MIHRRKLVVRPINVSDWIFDIPANPFVRHLIKVLKGSAAIAGQSCPQSGLNRVLSSLWATCSLLPHLLLALRPYFHPSLLCNAALNQGSRWWEGQPGQAGGDFLPWLLISEAQAPGSGPSPAHRAPPAPALPPGLSVGEVTKSQPLLFLGVVSGKSPIGQAGSHPTQPFLGFVTLVSSYPPACPPTDLTKG